MLSPGIAQAAGGDGAGGDASRSCRRGDRGRLLGFERVASHPTAADARAYFDSWVEFYQDFYHFPEAIPVDIDYGFDTYKEGIASGLPQLSTPGSFGAGSVRAGALELSNTDIGKNLIDLVLATTQYRSNARVISTAQDLFDELLNLRR